MEVFINIEDTTTSGLAHELQSRLSVSAGRVREGAVNPDAPACNTTFDTKKCWAGKDSNLRRHSRQIYSLLRLTASLPARKPSWRSGLNRRPTVYKTVALPAELLQRNAFGKKRTMSLARRLSSPRSFTAKSAAFPCKYTAQQDAKNGSNF